MGDVYITREQLAEPPFSLTAGEDDSKYLEFLQDMTKELIDDLCEKNFESDGTEGSPATRELNGSGHDTLILKERLVSLDSVRLFSTETAYDEYQPTSFVVEERYLQWKEWGQTSARLIGTPGTFPKGVANIAVLGVWGYAAVPKPILYLQGRLIQRIMNDGEMLKSMQTEKMGDYSYTARELTSYIINDEELDTIVQNYAEQVGLGLSR